MQPTNVSRATLRTAFVLMLVLAVSLLFLAVVWTFLKPLLIGALLAGLAAPLYRWITRLVGGRTSLGAALTLLVLFVLMVGPLGAFVGVVVQQAINITNNALPWVQKNVTTASAFNVHDWIVQRYPSLADYVPTQQEIAESASRVAKTAGAYFVGAVTQFTAGTAGFLLNFFVMLYSLFFFLRDGRLILSKIFYYTPLDHDDEVRLLERFTSVTRATIKGTIVIGAVQGALAGLGLWAAGIEGAAFWATMMAVLSVLPGVGSAIVWLPAVIYLFVLGKTWTATLLLLWCAAGVGTIDNLLRPRLVGKDAQMPDLLILIGTLGGVFFFGLIGFIIGPLVCGLFLTVWEIYGATFKDILPPVLDFGTVGTRKGEVKATDESHEGEIP
jgi:predicted PurR-regulated permease PerM